MHSRWSWKVLGVVWGVCVFDFVFDFVFAVERMRRSNGPYMTRYYLLGWPARLLGDTGLFPNLYLQHFHQSDDPVPHNHPRWFLSWVLRGGYQEHRMGAVSWRGRPSPIQRITKHRKRPGAINWIPIARYHWITTLDKVRGCWTLCLVGPTWGRKWGFWWKGKHVDSKIYKREVLRAAA